MSNQNEQRLSQLVESNASTLLKVTEQLQHLQHVLTKETDIPGSTSDLRGQHKQIHTAELQLQQQTKEFQQQHEQQVHALNTLEQKIKALQTPSHVQHKTQAYHLKEDIVGTVEWCMKWTKTLTPYMMVVVVYMFLRKR
jgi:hypothetical protein